MSLQLIAYPMAGAGLRYTHKPYRRGIQEEQRIAILPFRSSAYPTRGRKAHTRRGPQTNAVATFCRCKI